MTETDPDTDANSSFGAAITHPHRPQPLTVPTHGEEVHRVYGEESSPSFGERALRAPGEGLRPLSFEGETFHRSPTPTEGRQTSAFIVGESQENGYRCDVCGQEFDSERALNRHVTRVGIVE